MAALQLAALFWVIITNSMKYIWIFHCNLCTCIFCYAILISFTCIVYLNFTIVENRPQCKYVLTVQIKNWEMLHYVNLALFSILLLLLK